MEQFFTNSDAVRHIIKGFNLTKTLFVSSILVGEKHTGKKTLIASLFPNTPWVDGRELSEIKEALSKYDELVISHFEQVSNYDVLDFQNKRIIAIADYISNPRNIDDLFAFIYKMPPLKDRLDDLDHLINKFATEAQNTLMIEKEIKLDYTILDLSQNSKTLKKSIYHQIMYQGVDPQAIEQILYHYFLETLEGNNGYKEHIHLFEKPLIQAGLKKFGSQLQLAHTLGINRNTLRKKIHEHAID